MPRDRAGHDMFARAELDVALAREAAEDARALSGLDAQGDLEETDRLAHAQPDVEANRGQLGDVRGRLAVCAEQRERVKADVSRRLLPDVAAELLGVQIDDTAPDRG